MSRNSGPIFFEVRIRWAEMQTWPALAKPADRDGLGGPLQIGVVHDDHGAVAAQFHRHPLDAGHLADVFADLVAAGEADLADAPVAAKGVAKDRAAAGETGDGFRRCAGFKQNLHQLERRKRRIARRFDDHGVACRQGRPDFVTDQVEGKVERRDRCDNPTRHAERKTDPPGRTRGRVERDHFADNAAGLFGGDFDRFARAAGFEPPFGEDFSFFATDGPRQFVLAALHDLGRAAQQERAVVGRHGPHFLGTAHERRQRPIDVGGRRLRHRVDHRAVVGIGNVNLFRPFDPLPCAKHLHRGT